MLSSSLSLSSSLTVKKYHHVVWLYEMIKWSRKTTFFRLHLSVLICSRASHFFKVIQDRWSKYKVVFGIYIIFPIELDFHWQDSSHLVIKCFLFNIYNLRKKSERDKYAHPRAVLIRNTHISYQKIKQVNNRKIIKLYEPWDNMYGQITEHTHTHTHTHTKLLYIYINLKLTWVCRPSTSVVDAMRVMSDAHSGCHSKRASDRQHNHHRHSVHLQLL